MGETTYPGKFFEEDFKSGCVINKVRPIRLYDPVGGFKGVANICDFIIYRYPYMICLELKSTKGKRFDFSKMSDIQYEGLLGQYKVNKAIAGLLIHFSEIPEQETVFVPISIIEKIKEEGRASIRYEEALASGTLLISEKKRTRFKYNVDEDFFRRLKEDGEKES